MSSAYNPTRSKKTTNDDRGGLKFGADTAYDSDSEYISALPTDEEERMLLAAENVKAREKREYLDEGMASNHPSTLATSSDTSSGGREVSTIYSCNRLWMLISMIKSQRIIITFLLTNCFAA